MSPALVLPNRVMNGNDLHLLENEKQCQQLQKGVINLSESGMKRVPQKYVLPISERPDMVPQSYDDDNDENLHLPIIDFAALQDHRRSEALKSLASACENFGFFQLVNHGLPNEVVSNMVSAARRFFALPATEREKYMSSDMNRPVRYGTSFNQLNDKVFSWRDFLKLVCQPDLVSQWPSLPVDFREMAATYAKETKQLFLFIVDAILESLGLDYTENDDHEDEVLLKDIKDGSQQTFINYYPTCPEPDLTVGLRAHSDFGFLTLLLQDEVPGLQVRLQEKWFTVEPLPGSFVINVGDQLEIFSNGRYKSIVHRVVTNSKKSRMSVASLYSLPLQSVVRPSKMLIDEAKQRHYKDTSVASFIEYIKANDYKERSFLESMQLSTQGRRNNQEIIR